MKKEKKRLNFTNPGNAERNAAGYKAGKNAGPHGGNSIGDHVKNGPDGAIILFKNDEPAVGEKCV